MRIGLQTWGSDGDIRPFTALAGGLAAAGHDVTLAVTSVDGKDYSRLAEAMRFGIIHTPTIPAADGIAVARRILKSRDPAKQMRLLFEEVFAPSVDDIAAASRTLCEENDAVVGHHIVYPLAAAAELHERPHGTVTFCHGMIATRHEPPPGFPNLGPWVNALIWRTGAVVVDRFLKRLVNGHRTRLGLEPLGGAFGGGWFARRLNMIAVSPALCARHADWDGRHQVCGFFNVPGDAEPWKTPDDLKTFLASGPRPVYMTFGSMTQFDPVNTTALMAEAARRAGVRAIIQSDWSLVGKDTVTGGVYPIGPAPHQRIFPECAAVVHHGGSGTTQAAARAGRPSVVVEHGFDQFFWGRTLRRAGMAGKPLHRRRVTAGKLARAISDTVGSATLRERAERAGAAMRREDGVGRAVGLIEERLSP